ncbi:DNA-binding transcriptional activator of the SARP family [Bradyrhizobium lablabi]|uniref:DNA-binding transcriptional activator of the SARP family n=4 Tax=Nitrobacteraceae TaxID=41294 RepID=A0ABY0PZ97_9BRAD|nr:DNA-binding transcriptional activator of the SARP family [Bradyrhizobium ottawaense]SEC81735.1 DNA-binding transcriptional activator of the SARP family [Bradyrhizobium lablabi]SHK92350.1 DNA-binding transcriptional activator of the SARP family [Bradyrhizobium lablabi]
MRGSASAMSADEAAMARENAPRLSVSLVGRFGLRLNGRPIELRTRKAAAVLGYLALSDTKHESRERLVGLLWSRSDEEKARASLRQVVRELRSVLEEAGFGGFVAERLMIGISIAQMEVDIESVLQQAENERVHPLLLDAPQLDERLLEGMDDLDPSFRVWVLAKRQTIHERLMRSLEAGLIGANVPRDTKKKFAAAIVNLDPTHEHACRYLMRAHAEEGDTAGALRIYKSLWDLLDRDYGMEPSPATEELVASIKLGVFEPPLADRGAHAKNGVLAVRAINGSGLQPAPAASPLSNAPVKTLLVLRPFAMHGIDEDHGHLVQGFSQHLAACLVRFREWSVVDRAPAADLLPVTGAAPQYCIETTAYQAGAEINIVMVLRDDTTGIYVWSESFRLGLSNWFETQQRIIRRIATSLNVQLSTERLMRLAGEPDVSLDLHDRWLRGQNLITKFDPESWQRAVSIFRDAIRENPTFSPCYSSLVQMNNIEHFVHPGLFHDLEKARTTLELAKTAVQLDPVDSRAHLCCGWSHVMVGRGAEAAPHMELACELNDNDPWTLLSCAAYCAFCGSIEQAELRARQAHALSLAPSGLEWGYQSIIAFLCGDYAGAIEASGRAHGVIKTLPAWRAAALYELGDTETAREEAQRFLNGIRSFWVGSAAPTDEAVTRWLLQAHPININSRWEALRSALGGAGLPVESITRI